MFLLLVFKKGDYMLSMLNLFKALPIETHKGKKPSEDLLKKTISRGFIFSDEIIYNYSNYNDLIKLVEQVVGIRGSQANASFHKSWKKIKDASIEQLVVEQLAHYVTTYGKENPEWYLMEKEIQWNVDDLPDKIIDLKDFEGEKQDKSYVYIPNEILNIPDVKIDNIKLTIIKGYTKEEIKAKLLKLLGSGIALKQSTIDDIIEVALFVKLTEQEIRNIKNKEVRVILYRDLNIIPSKITFRHMIPFFTELC